MRARARVRVRARARARVCVCVCVCVFTFSEHRLLRLFAVWLSLAIESVKSACILLNVAVNDVLYAAAGISGDHYQPAVSAC